MILRIFSVIMSFLTWIFLLRAWIDIGTVAILNATRSNSGSKLAYCRTRALGLSKGRCRTSLSFMPREKPMAVRRTLTISRGGKSKYLQIASRIPQGASWRQSWSLYSLRNSLSSVYDAGRGLGVFRDAFVTLSGT